MSPKAPNNVIQRNHRIWVAQRLNCYLCGGRLSDDPRLQYTLKASVDHVKAKRLGGVLYRNKLLAHIVCNQRKGSRRAFACEMLFLEVVNEVLDWKVLEDELRRSEDLSYVQILGHVQRPGGASRSGNGGVQSQPAVSGGGRSLARVSSYDG